jgi:hypothetical protein
VVSLGWRRRARYSLAIPLDLFLSRREEMEREDGGREGPQRAWVGFYPQASTAAWSSRCRARRAGRPRRAGPRRPRAVGDGSPVSSLRELYAAMWKRSAGEALSLQILRESAIRVVEVETGDRAEFYR